MVEKIIEYYEEIVMEHKWNKINWIIILGTMGASIVSILYQRTVGCGILMFEIILMIIIGLIAFLVALKVFEEIINKHKLNINEKKINIFLAGKNFKEIFCRKKKQLIKSKLQEQKLDRDGKKVLIESLYNKYNELSYQKNVAFSIFSFIATACVVLVTIKIDSGKLIIEGLEIYIAILIIAGGFLYMWNIIIDRLLFHNLTKKENLKALISIIEEIYMVNEP